MPPQESQPAHPSPEEQIAALRARVRELESSDPNKERGELVREAVRSYADAPVPMPPPDYSAEPAPALARDEGVTISIDSEHKDQILQLLNEVASKGVWKTVQKVRAMEPHIADDFHDALVQYLQAQHGV